ncbi:MAG: PEP/pyruvate-binding domain-containing protein [Polyangiaceae bacterium]
MTETAIDVHAPLAAPELSDAAAEVLRPLATVGLRRETREKRVGGKAAKLAELLRAGLPIVPGWVIDAKVFQRVVEAGLPKHHDVASLIKLGDTPLGVDRAARARDRVLELTFPEDVSAALEELWGRVAPNAPWGLSVRSSATVEDGRASSLAGLATSVLGVRSRRGLEDAIRQVWASLYLPRTLAYLGKWNLRAVSMPVLIQRTVVAEAAGVMFTGPPPGLEGELWKRSERVVHATLGLGAPIVDGASASDTWTLDARGTVVREVISDKPQKLVVTERGLDSVDTGDAIATPALGRRALSRLAQIARELELAGREPLDVEFAVEGGSIVILQARPLTGGLFPEGGDEQTIWSRANVGEALPGAATPLTWSIARRIADEGFRSAFGALGCKVPKSSVLVANVNGRFYLNLTTFMTIAAQVPGLDPRSILGLSGGVDAKLIESLEKLTEDVDKRGFLFRAPLTLPKLLARQVGLQREVAAFDTDAERQHKLLREMDLAILPDDAFVQTFRRVMLLLSRGADLMLNCASASLASHIALTQVVQRSLPRSSDDEDAPERRARAASSLAQTLTGGISQLESASPGIALLRVAGIARREPAAREKILSGDARDLAQLPSGATRAALLEFLDAFGDRSVREAELSTPRWREDPGTLFAMLAAALRGPAIDPDAAPARSRLLADRTMAKLEASMSRFQIGAVRLLVARTQHFTRLRERMRAWVTRTLGMIRMIALNVDTRLCRIDPSLPEGSVFFCTYDELNGALARGRADIGHVLRLRRAEYLRDLARPDPPASFIGRPPPVTLPPSDGPRLEGLPASAGVVEGFARVLGPAGEGLAALQAGEILVARTTDVGLSPLFLVATGLVTELGGPLSHAAIVAREYGLPAVVNVEGATRSIRTGDRLRVDGDRGVIEKLGSRDS